MQQLSQSNTAAGAFVLLMSAGEAKYFERLLKNSNKNYMFFNPQSKSELMATTSTINGQSRLIAFCSSIIVPQSVLDVFTSGCFNFHPGPPEYRGIRPSYFAIKDRVSQFGVTFHSISKEIDSGTIHHVRRFPIQTGMSRIELDMLAYRTLLELTESIIVELADMSRDFPLSGVQWSGPLHMRRELPPSEQ